MLKQSQSIKRIWTVFGALALTAALAAIIWLTINLSSAPGYNGNVLPTPTPAETLTTSSSGKYEVRLSETSGVVLQNGDTTISLVDEPVNDDSHIFAKNNVAWSPDESRLVLTYININEQTAYIAFYDAAGKFISKTALDQAFYGNNQDRAFPPAISPDNKYVAVQTELIHKFSVFDLDGKFVKTLNTKYAGVELFSDQMYELENNTYSPFLDYNWNSESSGVLYRFQDTDTFFEVDL